MGLRFRLHDRRLPGRPDIVLARHRTVVFVHGCFWHRHPGCRLTTTPSTRRKFWLDKFSRSVERDAQVQQRLIEAGWRVVTVWECETRRGPELERVLASHFPGQARHLQGVDSVRGLR
jgi:DNA mismatch endonuclease (patch repair protein)